MLATSAAFAASIDGGELLIDARVTLTLPAAAAAYNNVTLAVDELTIEASLQTDVAPGTRVQSGTSSVSASLTLSGFVDPNDDSKTAAWLFGPYQSTSPLYRSTVLQCPVTIDVGIYTDQSAGTPELVRKFTGFVDGVSIGDDGSVKIQCYDKRNTLRGTTDTPAVVTAPPLNSGLTSEYAIDAILRAASGGAISSWPKARPSCVFASGMRSSVWPEVGGLGASPGKADPTFAPGVFGTALAAVDGTTNFTLAAPVGDAFVVEFWTTGASGYPFLFSIGDGSVTGAVSFATTGTGYFVDMTVGGTSRGSVTNVAGFPSAPGPHYWQIAVTWPAGSTSATIKVTRDATTKTDTFTGMTAARPSAPWSNLGIQYQPQNVAAGAVDTIEAVQVSNESAPASNRLFAPQAIIAPSLNPLQVIPATSGDPWQSIQAIAAAELAVALFDEAGIFRYVTRQNIASSTVARKLTLIDAMGVDQNLASVRNRAQVTSSSYTFNAAGTVWSLAAPTLVPKGATIKIVAKTDTPVSSIAGGGAKLSDNASAGSLNWYRLSREKSGATDYPGSVTMRTAQTASDTVEVTVTNPNSVDVWLVSSSAYTDVTAGTPFLKLGGVTVTPGESAVADRQYPPVEADGSGGAASSRWSELNVQISGNPWIQDPGAAAALAAWITQDMPTPRPDLTGVSIDPDVRLQLMDRAEVVETDRHGVDEHAVIFGWTFTLRGDAASMTVDARTVTSPGGWLLGIPGRSELAATTNI